MELGANIKGAERMGKKRESDGWLESKTKQEMAKSILKALTKNRKEKKK